LLLIFYFHDPDSSILSCQKDEYVAFNREFFCNNQIFPRSEDFGLSGRALSLHCKTRSAGPPTLSRPPSLRKKRLSRSKVVFFQQILGGVQSCR